MVENIRSGQDLFALVEEVQSLGDPVALLRSAQILYSIAPTEPERCKRIVSGALLAPDPVVRLYAQAIVAQCVNREISIARNQTNLVGIGDLKPALTINLNRLESAEFVSLLSLEAQCETLIALAICEFSLLQPEKARDYASRARLLSDGLGTSLQVGRSIHLLIACHNTLGELDVVQQLSAGGPNPTYWSLTQFNMESFTGNTMLLLGNFQSAVKHHRNLVVKYPEIPDQKSFLQLAECWAGVMFDEAVVESPTETMPTGFLIHGHQKALQALAVPRDNDNLRLYRNLLAEGQAALESYKGEIIKGYLSEKNWLQGWFSYHLGDDKTALSYFQGIGPFHAQHLIQRTRVVGLWLELAISYQLPDFGIEPAEAELRSIFGLARSIAGASPEGLAEHLELWHPLAAAYGAIMPNPVPELVKATQNILELGRPCCVASLEIGPSLACELVLRSLRLDLLSAISVPQAALSKLDRQRRNTLMQKNRWRSYFQPLVSTHAIAYGLMKGQTDGHRETAEGLLVKYGLSPKSWAAYEGRPLLDEISSLTRRLVAQEITLKGFSKEFGEMMWSVGHTSGPVIDDAT
jgi:hypothetical protein